MQKITPFLWFDSNAEEAANFYTSIFKNSRINEVVRYGEGGPLPTGTVLTVAFELDGNHYTAMNGGPMYKFTEAVSFVVSCDSQEEVDFYWDKLLEGGGKPSACGWLKDKFGLSWQVVPLKLIELMKDKDREKAGRVMQAMMQMVKIDVPTLERAYRGE